MTDHICFYSYDNLAAGNNLNLCYHFELNESEDSRGGVYCRLLVEWLLGSIELLLDQWRG